MKKIIVSILILIAATAYITVKYFKNLNTSGTHAGNITRTIPNNAALVLEFANEKSFYDIFTDNKLLGSLIGERKLSELDTVRKVLFGNVMLDQLFNGSNIFVSAHPLHDNDVELLLTAAAAKDFDITQFDRLAKLQKTGFVITPLKIGDKKGYTVYFSSLKKRFYIINKEDNIFSASFSKELLDQSAAYKGDRDDESFLLLPDKQNSNSLANLYVNYEQLNPLFNQLFKNNNSDLFKSFKLLPALAALNLNYKTDALMFNGYSNILHNKPASYLNLFASQQPMVNDLKEIFPSTTAYAMSMAVSDPKKFSANLSDFHNKAGLKAEREQLFNKIKTETGINLYTEFSSLLGKEFAVVTTRYREKFAIITIKDGSKLRPFMNNISGMLTEDVGQFNYGKLPFFLLGDAFNGFRQPYFRIIDNYLVLANTVKELESYNDTYFNRKYLNKTEQYLSFDNLLAERSNVVFFINFKNSQQILKADLKEDAYNAYKNDALSMSNFYAASYQIAAADKNFYTNFCMLKNKKDTLQLKKE
ncbi:hypothetical protein [Mucilaginibacter glaciei]|uniref:DUF3352 domain-containing protein n=1 Tax=Mucilaginibacter glaciei TaxID=2772109 RepID=A0A926RZF0_9SPHI|nr:hypothetical protein [Mucilaginibacter glaciei]MBD1391795.1 hypothetical protein [Mucilaginibacter glaciei]